MNSMLIITNLAIGPLLLILALIFKAFPPKKINWAYGYRTSRSKKSQEAWDAANKYSNDLMLWVAIITITAQVVLYFVFAPATALVISCTVMCILLIIIIFVVENYLKENFDAEGKRKT